MAATHRIKLAVGGLIAGGAMLLAPVALASAAPVVGDLPTRGGGALLNGEGGGGAFIHGKAGGGYMTGNAGGEFFKRAREAACSATPMACNPTVSIGVGTPGGTPTVPATGGS